MLRKKDENVDPHNDSNGGSGSGSGGTEDPEGKDKVSVPKQGKSSVNAPQVIRQRVVKMPSKSTYRIAFVLENDCSKVNVSLKKKRK